ncbi:MAG: spermidine/putrescine transport system ATP-binding protein [Candidatus Methanomethylophilaceae archaeon]|nr:spermidine/putrescine transport system ATP-binding protein [Candidatus Methanomethylophilaceae archaeon]MDI3541465.1 spermidine/putrescine transport system ATP-binding protein [Candidatus Methanomethylophilaceae archaeon]HIJ00356.1 ABC transporter ATP-binding protein [Candidatus Methanomethylophilaceae archaeon]
MTTVELRNLTKRYGKVVAADGLSLKVEDGEYMCLLGPTGAGKTTALRMVAGLLSPDEGQVLFDDKDCTHLEPEYREAVMLSQNYSLFPHMDVNSNVIYGPRIKGWDPDESQEVADNMLEMVHLQNRKDAMPRELSGGMQQRTALARALASGSKVILLDEPLRALDARLRIELRREIVLLAKAMGITAIHVTHDQEEAMVIADRIAVMRGGKVIQVGTPREVFDDPATPFVANFLGQSNFFVGKVVGKENDITIVENDVGVTVKARMCPFPMGEEVVVAVKVGNTTLKHNDGFFMGRVERILYEGTYIHIDVLANGERYAAKVPNRKYEDFSEGEEVLVGWPPTEAKVFAMPPEGLAEELRLE